MPGTSLTQECAASSLAPLNSMSVAKLSIKIELLDQLALTWRFAFHMRALQQSDCLLTPEISHKDRKSNLLLITCDSALLQVITSGCATYEPWASALGGIVGGLLVLPGSLFVLHVLKVDDPVDAVTVHYIGSIMHAQICVLFLPESSSGASHAASVQL